MQVTAASMPPKWMARWAGVQNVSRPMVMCQEISQYKPKVIEVTAAAPDQTCQGTAATRLAIPAGSARDVISSGILCAINDAQLSREQTIADMVIRGDLLGSMRARTARVASRSRLRNTQPKS